MPYSEDVLINILLCSVLVIIAEEDNEMPQDNRKCPSGMFSIYVSHVITSAPSVNIIIMFL
jgi:hypothetical protein